jgi:hypothetical protein
MDFLRKHNIVNNEQAFAVMKFLVEVVNSNLYKMMKFEDEKISQCTKIDLMKCYDMLGRMKIEKDKVKWIFAGSQKSDTLPFVNELLYDCRVLLLTLIAKGRTIKQAVTRVIVLIKMRLLDFAMGKVPTYDLAITQRLSKFDPTAARQTQHSNVAIQMNNRGEPVHGGDDIIYIFAKDKTTGEKRVDSLDYLLNPKSNLEPDLKTIFESRIKSKITGYMLYLLAPLSDVITLDSAYEEIRQSKEKEKSAQMALQTEYVEAVLYKGHGDIEWRLNKREFYANQHRNSLKMTHMFKKMANTTTTATTTANMTVKTYPAQMECCICTAFFDPRVYSLTKCACEKPVTRSRTGTRVKSEPMSSDEMVSSEEEYDYKDEDYKPSSRVEYEETSQCSCKGNSCVRTALKLDPTRHIEIAYDDGVKEEHKEDDGEKEKYFLKHKGGHHMVCPNCLATRKDEEVIKLQKQHKETSDKYFLERSKCLVCIQMAQVPVDTKKPDTPESCRLTDCLVYKSRESLYTACLMHENTLAVLGSHHMSW